MSKLLEQAPEKDQPPDSPQYKWWVRLGLAGHLSRKLYNVQLKKAQQIITVADLYGGSGRYVRATWILLLELPEEHKEFRPLVWSLFSDVLCGNVGREFTMCH